MSEIIYENLPGIWCQVDAESRYTYLNDDYANLVGINTKYKDSFIGKTVADIPCKAAECASEFWKEDNLVRKNLTDIKALNIIQLAQDNWKILELFKRPILDKDNNLTGILFHIQDHTSLGVMQFSRALFQATNNHSLLISNNNYGEINLTTKESECLFLLLRGHRFKDIASIQRVSSRTIIDHIERLKFKFNVADKFELIAKAMQLGYINHIPQSIFKTQQSIIISE